MVGVLGFEPRTSSLSGTRSNQLSYTPLNPLKVATLRSRPNVGLGMSRRARWRGSIRARCHSLRYPLKVERNSYRDVLQQAADITSVSTKSGAEGARTLDILLAKQVL